ncbi:MAG: DUF4440 domain-containing protein [Xanthomonadales bacterium]|uniref:YybH family protein n=1 Tax=Hydrogenophaga sp. TaxID=1904254 RepID=UPI00169B6BA3|nr:DUF4440 domain-containing protein [Hydrogenophaga sp.]NIM69014.1 DUF4440 domain-containing protein [Xanthomonadales bacterium]NIN58313.1 DUF4440 domain-containing protein [Xanthomonadales bacterium]NIN73658.1 DUF4440 domain-containing protein [Xanthomonadales bacterium]NIO14443.1 DUF4440 domain-containing protein [Xanthomonadales bacterium]NIP10706.1 DUF4440 domain-containing protein [Xanthomonadales bacterium]
MKRIVLHGLWALVLVALLPAASPADDEADRIEAEGGKWANYFQAGDLEGLMTLYMDDAIVALHGQPALYGKAAVREYFAQRLGKSDTTFELDYELRETHGDIAYIISKYWLVAVDRASGERYLDAGRSLLVYKKHAGRWKIAADIDQATPDVGWPSPGGLQ